LTAHVLISGTLFRAPESRVSKSGRNFVTATLRCKDGDGSQFWRATAFSETAQSELLRLGDGDSVSVQGALKVELYRPDGGEPRISLSVVADSVLPLRAAPKERKPKATTSPREEAPDRVRHGGAGEANPELNDAIPF
jgi:single-stranded DNA-binding protein